MTRSAWDLPGIFNLRVTIFLIGLSGGRAGSFQLSGVGPITERLRHLFDSGFRIDRSDQGNHHPTRAVAAPVEIGQVIPLDRSDRLRPTILRPGIRMPFEDDLVKGDRSHIGSIFGALGQAGQELRTQAFNLLRSERSDAAGYQPAMSRMSGKSSLRERPENPVLWAPAPNERLAPTDSSCIEDLLEGTRFRSHASSRAP